MKGENAKREISEGIEAVRSVAARAGEIEKIASELRGKVKKIYAVACGSSLAVNQAIAFWLRESGADAEAIPSSEFYNHGYLLGADTLVILSSQSGKTTETVRAMDYAKRNGAITFAISNFSDSPLASGSDYSFSLNLAKEVAVMATKTVDATLAAGYIFARSLGEKDFSKIHRAHQHLEKAISLDISNLAEMIKPFRSAYVIGSGLDYAAGLEMAIKIGEGAQVQATPMHTLEVSHGPKAAASNLPAIVIGLQPVVEADTIRVIKEMLVNGTRIISISPAGKNFGGEINIEIDIDPELSPFAVIKIAQRLALELGISKGIDPDSPPSLKKVVEI